MGFIKSVNELYSYDEDIYKLLDYIFEPAKYTTGVYGTYNVFADPFIRTDIVAEQFILVNKHRPLRKRLHHVIFSFDNVLDEATPAVGKRIGDTLLRLYPNYQSVYGLHEDNSFLHLHLVYNNAPIDSRENPLTNLLHQFHIYKVAEEIIENHLSTLKMKMPKTYH